MNLTQTQPQALALTQTDKNDKLADPYAMITGAVATEELPVIMPLRLAIVGPPGEGKSWLAATAPKPIMYYDFDNRAASLRGKHGIKIKTLVDSNPNNPTVINELENDLTLFKSAKSSKQAIPATFVFDSATYLKKSMENSLLKSEASMGLSFRLSPTKTFKTASAMTTANVIRNFFEYFINEFGVLGNIVFVFHTKDQIDKDKTTKAETKYTGMYTTEPQYLETVLSIFNERWRLERDFNFNYKVHTRNDRQFAAITSLRINDEEDADIEKILAKHEARVNAK